MKVKISIDFKDYWDFNKYGSFNIPKVRRRLILSIVIPHIMVTLACISLGLNIIVASLISFAADLLIVYSIKIKAKRIFNKSRIKDGYVIEISEKGVKTINSVEESMSLWKRVYDIKQTDKYIYIFISEVVVWIVTKKSFNSIHEANEFYYKAIKYWDEGKDCTDCFDL